MKLQRDLREFAELLNSAKVKYLIVGGHAVAHHGFPRFTGDIDFFVERSETNASALERVMIDFGFRSVGFRAEDFLEPEKVFQLGRPPNRIDILTSISGVDFGEAWAARLETALDGVPVFMLSKELLLRNKLASGRPKDLEDIRQLD